MADDLETRLAALTPPTMAPLVPHRLAAAGRRRRLRLRAVGGAVLAAAVLGTALTVPSLLQGGGDELVSADEPALEPLTLDGTPPLACGIAPLDVLDDPPGAERADTPQAAALREVLRTGIAGMSFPPKRDWVVLASTDTTQVFGHRTGPIGIDDVVTVEKRAGRWDFSNSGGCGSLTFGGREAAFLSTYRVQGNNLVLSWVGGYGPGSLGGGQEDVRLRESADVVSVLVVPGDGGDSSRPVNGPDVGVLEETVVPLASPLGGRRVEDASRYPPASVPSEQEYTDERTRFAAVDGRARTWCSRAAKQLGVRSDVSYPLAAGVVQRALPDLPEAYAALPPGTPVAQCYLRQEGSRWLSVVMADGLQPYVYDRSFTGPLYDRLGDP